MEKLIVIELAYIMLAITFLIYRIEQGKINNLKELTLILKTEEEVKATTEEAKPKEVTEEEKNEIKREEDFNKMMNYSLDDAFNSLKAKRGE